MESDIEQVCNGQTNLLLQSCIGKSTEDTLKKEMWLVIAEMRNLIRATRTLDASIQSFRTMSIQDDKDADSMRSKLDAISDMTKGILGQFANKVNYLKYAAILNDVEFQIASGKIPYYAKEYKITTSNIPDTDHQEFRDCIRAMAVSVKKMQSILDRNYPNEVVNRPIIKLDISTVNREGDGVTPTEFDIDKTVQSVFAEALCEKGKK